MKDCIRIWMAPCILVAVWVSMSGSVLAEEAAGTKPTAETAKPAAASVPDTSGYVVDFLDYRLEIQLRIEKIWADYLAQYGPQLKRGRAVFSYHVNPDGKVTLVEPKGGAKENDLSILAHRSILEANKSMSPFPPSVREKHPSGYFNQIAFAVK